MRVQWHRLPAQAELFLAQHRVVHRNMKRDKVLVKPDGSPCLCEFGEAVITVSVASACNGNFVCACREAHLTCILAVLCCRWRGFGRTTLIGLWLCDRRTGLAVTHSACVPRPRQPSYRCLEGEPSASHSPISTSSSAASCGRSSRSGSIHCLITPVPTSLTGPPAPPCSTPRAT